MALSESMGITALKDPEEQKQTQQLCQSLLCPGV